MDRVTITTFTDPMMGLSYESEPIFIKLETHFPDAIEFRYVMSVLVRDVYQLVDPNDMVNGTDVAIRNYNKKLAKIYKSEEHISGMPINMTNFELFSEEYTSSLPLNIAYKAMELLSPEKAGMFLYNLRYATIVECRPTTRLEEILKIIKNMNIDENDFLKYYNSKDAEKELQKDLQLCYKLAIRTLPAYLISYGKKSLLISSLMDYKEFLSEINRITEGYIKPINVKKDVDLLRKLIEKHPLISLIEIKEAFDFDKIDDVKKFIYPMLEKEEIKNVCHGKFIKSNK